MKLLEKLSDSERKELQKGVIEVHGKAMNRTALGVVDAMLQLYPRATFEELKAMLPDSINPAAPKNYKSLFKPYTDKMYGVIQPGSIRKECEENEVDINASHFTGDNETFKTIDGIEVLVSKNWESKDTETGEHDLENLINHVGQYGIRVVSFESNKPFKKGEYLIEIINPVLVHRIQNPRTKKFPWWILLLLLTLFGVALFFILHKSSINETAEPIPTAPQSKVTVIIEDKPTITELKSQIKSGINTEGKSLSFHEILFEKGSDVILPESEAYLLEILSFLNDIPELALGEFYNLKL